MEFLRPKRVSLSLDMTPMIDIVFQLLIFFMLTSSYLSPSLKLTLPKALSKDAREPEEIVVNIDKAGEVFVNTRRVPMDGLKTFLESKWVGGQDKAIHLRGDAEMPYRLFVQAMDLARQAGAKQIHIVHEASTGTTASDGGKHDFQNSL